MLKRMFDLVAALLGLLVLSPLLLIIALAVRLSSPGPALFRQTRVGRGGADFTLYKFRTMTVREGSKRGGFDAGDTSRVTRIGGFLRATKLDELPQLWNVLWGDMALVGPRPEVRKWVEDYYLAADANDFNPNQFYVRLGFVREPYDNAPPDRLIHNYLKSTGLQSIKCIMLKCLIINNRCLHEVWVDRFSSGGPPSLARGTRAGLPRRGCPHSQA